jgi:hypothetical protein
LLVEPAESCPNISLEGVILTAALDAVPVPLSETVCGVLDALSAIESIAASVPTCDGVKVTEMVQEADGAIVLRQLFVWVKSLGFAPLKLNTGDTMPPVPVSDSVNVRILEAVPFGVGGNDSVPGKTAPFAIPAFPVPLKVTVWGEPVTLSAIESVALSAPVLEGVNVTLIVHVAPTATEAQVFVWLKSAGFVPRNETADDFRAIFPVLSSVIVRATDAAPWYVEGNVRVVGLTMTPASPFPGTLNVADAVIAGLTVLVAVTVIVCAFSCTGGAV